MIGLAGGKKQGCFGGGKPFGTRLHKRAQRKSNIKIKHGKFSKRGGGEPPQPQRRGKHHEKVLGRGKKLSPNTERGAPEQRGGG